MCKLLKAPGVVSRIFGITAIGLIARRRRQLSILGGRRKRLLSADLSENSAQLVKVHRFSKVKIESGFFAEPDVFVRSKSSESYAFNWVFLFCPGNHLVAAAIGKPDVAQHDIELLRLHDLQSALCVIGD